MQVAGNQEMAPVALRSLLVTQKVPKEDTENLVLRRLWLENYDTQRIATLHKSCKIPDICGRKGEPDTIEVSKCLRIDAKFVISIRY